MEHPDHTDEGYSVYMMTQAAYVLYSTTKWQDPADVGDYFIVPTTAITYTNHKSEESKWQSRKDLLGTFRNMCTALQQLFEIAIDSVYRPGVMTNTGMERRGFVNDQQPAILERLKIFYGPPSLHYPMDCNQPVEVMIHTTGGYCDLSNVNIISYAMIKLSKCGGLCMSVCL